MKKAASILWMPSLLAMILAMTLPLAAAPAAPGLPDLGTRQETLKGDLRKTDERLLRLIAEFERNRIVREDVGAIRGFHTILSGLSENEIRQILSSLQTMEAQTDPTKSPAALKAMGAQGATIRKLEAITLEWKRRNALLNLAVAFRDLSKEQDENMRATRDLAVNIGPTRRFEELEFATQSTKRCNSCVVGKLASTKGAVIILK